MKPVLDAVVKLVTTIRSRGLTRRQFRDFLQCVQSECSDVLYYTKVRWLSAGCVFERIWQLKDDIVSFFHEKQCSAECEMLEDTEWLLDLAFFTDLLCHMNNLNVKMQGKNQFIDNIWAHLKAFKLKLNLFAGQLAKNDLSHFSRLNSIPSVNEEKLKNYEDGLKKLRFEFKRRFQDFSGIKTELDIFTMPFNVNCEAVRSDLQLELIELQSNNHLKQSFLNMPKLEFYKSLLKVEEGSPFGGAECDDSSPEPAQVSEDHEQGEENLFPFVNVSVELYEGPDAAANTNAKDSEQNNEASNDTAAPKSPEVENVETTPDLNLHMDDDDDRDDVPDSTGPDTKDASLTSDVYDTTVIKSEPLEPDYKQLHKTYIEDFIYSNASSFDEGSNSNFDDSREEHKGSPLSRFPKVVKAVEQAEYETLQVLFQLLYQRSAWDTQEVLAHGILEFSGFNFGPNSEDYFNREMLLRTQPDEMLAKIGILLGLEQQVQKMLTDLQKARPELIGGIMYFLSRPSKKTRTFRSDMFQERMDCHPSNEESVRRLHALLRRDQDEVENDDIETSGSEDFVERRDESTDTEQDEDPEIKSNDDSKEGHVLGANGTTIWKTTSPPQNTRTLQSNIVTYLPGVQGLAKNAVKPVECWDYLFDSEIIQLIVNSTNYQISLTKQNYSRPRDARDTDECEIKALIGLIYMIGIKKLNHTRIEDIWASDMSGDEFIRTAMSLRRFKFLLQHIRLDDKQTRLERKKLDKLAPVRQFCDRMIQNYQRNYTVGKYATIDEKLMTFRGRCSFRQYIPSKPAKYGLKIFTLVDASTYYTVNMEIYPGKQPTGPFDQSMIPQDVVLRLSRPIHGTGRNITMDSWFSSLPVCKDLLELKLTMVGTVSKNKKELPSSVALVKKIPIYSSQFFFDEEKTLVSYHPKKNKVVILLSTMHHNAAIDGRTGEEKKPEILTFYNATKLGVDTVDQLCSLYNVARNTRRWPMAIFYAFLNVTGLNSYVIYTANQQTTYTVRKLFLKSLASDLVKDFVKRRLYTSKLPRELGFQVKKLHNILEPESSREPEVVVNNRDTSGKRKRCMECPRKVNRMTNYRCQRCGNFICLKDHTKFVCRPCFDHRFQPLNDETESE
ncbi:General transcription factor II-I repeat domain-containing protein 2A [Araneus ventricosus]|uniref:General transcription factor II-I repeat domain-containing protein 2A n=1 Tax=Araneus ventricosus TaxID=182803 RepID=A0A4Y2BKE1_ARAVE|nr:General transcription factor II-I repeat domain-containing protein 2A [Araneus ventricosus]